MESLKKFSGDLEKVVQKFRENFTYGNIEKFLQNLRERKTKFSENLKKILQKFCESYAEISNKFCRNFEKFLWKL